MQLRMLSFPLLLAFIGAAVAAPPPPGADIANKSASLMACRDLPVEQQRACVEPLVADLPADIRKAVLAAIDPDVQLATDAWDAERKAATRNHADSLAARGGSRNLLAAAYLVPTTAEGQAWFAEALAAEPVDPLALWVQANGCALLADECNREHAMARLLEADPGNAAVHLLALDVAADEDDAQVARHLRNAVQAERYEPFWPDMLFLLFNSRLDIVQTQPPPEVARALGVVWGREEPFEPSDLAALEAFGAAMATVDSSMFALRHACGNGDVLDTDMAGDCRAIHSRLAEESPILIDQLLALTALSQLTAGDASGDGWREQLRELYWVHENALQFMPDVPGSGSGIGGGEYMQLFIDRGELGAMRELLRRNGVATEPPADWLPEDESRRRHLTND